MSTAVLSAYLLREVLVTRRDRRRYRTTRQSMDSAVFQRQYGIGRAQIADSLGIALFR